MRISVIIPCRNEVAHIQECVESVFACNVLPEHSVEVIVVDGMSDDGTLELLHDLQTHYPDLHVVPNPAQVTPFALNLGIRQASGEVIQRIDAHQILSSNYLQDALDFLLHHEDVWLVGGRMDNVYVNDTARVISRAMGTPFGVGAGTFRSRSESGYVDTVTAPMIRREVFDKVGMFDEELVRNQDDDFSFRVIQQGGKIYFNTDIQLQYFVRATYRNVLRQYYQYGYWKVFVNRKHKRITSIRQLFPFLLVSGVGIGAILSILLPMLAPLYLSVLGLYLGLAVFFALRAAQKPGEIAGIFCTFLLLHFGYGAGYAKGIIDFLVLRKKPAASAQKLTR